MPRFENTDNKRASLEQAKSYELERRIQRLEETCGELNRKYTTLLNTITQIQKRSSPN